MTGESSDRARDRTAERSATPGARFDSLLPKRARGLDPNPMQFFGQVSASWGVVPPANRVCALRRLRRAKFHA